MSSTLKLAELRAEALAHLTREQRARVERARAMRLLQRYSEDEPRDDQGRWTSGGGDGGSDKPGSSGGSLKDRLKDFVNGPGLAAVHAVAEKLKENQRELLAGAVTAGLYHVAGLDFGPDVEAAVHNEVTHFAENAQVSMLMARDYMRRAVDALVALRKGQKADEDDILEHLLKLKAVLDKDELFEEKPEDKPK
jgi:hypothetical protein